MYQQRLLGAAMDFDDLIMNTAPCCSAGPDVLDHYRRRFKHILVDEYQDTNTVQNELVIQLASAHRNICVVGDTDQSIYRFRGADMRNILEFEEVSRHDRDRARAELSLDADDPRRGQRGDRQQLRAQAEGAVDRLRRGPAIVRYHADDETDESQWVAHEISRLHDEGERWGDVAVFYRTNAMSRRREEQLMRLGIPYKVVGGTRFYDRREVKDALAYMQAVGEPGRRGEREAGDQRAEARGGRLDGRQARRVGHGARRRVHRRAAPGRRRRRQGAAR